MERFEYFVDILAVSDVDINDSIAEEVSELDIPHQLSHQCTLSNPGIPYDCDEAPLALNQF